MKKFAKVLLATALASALLIGCGKTKTLESYFDDNKEELEQLEESSGCDISCEGNTITFSYDLGIEVADDEKDSYAEQFEAAMSGMESTFTSSKKMIEDETDLEIEMVIQYLDSTGAEVYSQTF